MNGVAYTILMKNLVNYHGEQSILAQAFGEDWKGKISVILYAVAIVLSWFSAIGAFILYIIVACIWFIPDKRIENKLAHRDAENQA